MSLTQFRLWYDRILGAFIFILMIATTVIVLLGIFYRYVLNDSLTWYDEVGEYALVWVTYYGAAYAALKRQHIGFPTVLRAFPYAIQFPATIVVEAMVIGFFVLMAWIGFVVFDFMQYEYLVALPEVNMKVPFSALPYGSILYVISELLNLPDVLKEARGLKPPAGHEIEDGIA